MLEYLEKGNGKGHMFRSPEIEKEILEIVSHKILQKIMTDIKILCNIL